MLWASESYKAAAFLSSSCTGKLPGNPADLSLAGLVSYAPALRLSGRTKIQLNPFRDCVAKVVGNFGVEHTAKAERNRCSKLLFVMAATFLAFIF